MLIVVLFVLIVLLLVLIVVVFIFSYSLIVVNLVLFELVVNELHHSTSTKTLTKIYLFTTLFALFLIIKQKKKEG